MRSLNLIKRFSKAAVILLTALTFAGATATAQDLVASYADPVGTIIRYRAADGAEVSRIRQVYRTGAITNLPTRIGVVDNDYYYVVFGERYLARLRAIDGTIVWIVDAGKRVAYTTYFVRDITVAGGAIFVATGDPSGHITKYQTSNGAVNWSLPQAVHEGVLLHNPLKLAAVGTDSFYALLGSKYLAKFSQSNGALIWKTNISVTIWPTTWGVGDLTVSGAVGYTSNVDPSGTVRKFNLLTGGSLIWSVSRTYPVGLIRYLPTKLAAVGTDSLMVLFGDRYLGRLSPVSGTLLWTKDIGVPVYNTKYSATDIAAVPTP